MNVTRCVLFLSARRSARRRRVTVAVRNVHARTPTRKLIPCWRSARIPNVATRTATAWRWRWRWRNARHVHFVARGPGSARCGRRGTRARRRTAVGFENPATSGRTEIVTAGRTARARCRGRRRTAWRGCGRRPGAIRWRLIGAEVPAIGLRASVPGTRGRTPRRREARATRSARFGAAGPRLSCL